MYHARGVCALPWLWLFYIYVVGFFVIKWLYLDWNYLQLTVTWTYCKFFFNLKCAIIIHKIYIKKWIAHCAEFINAIKYSQTKKLMKLKPKILKYYNYYWIQYSNFDLNAIEFSFKMSYTMLSKLYRRVLNNSYCNHKILFLGVFSIISKLLG